MKHLARATLTLAVLALLAAIWAPGPWWSWLLTALVLLFAGAGLAGADNTDDEPTGTTSPSGLEQTPTETRHVITTGPLGTRSQRTPTYGQPADKENER